MNLNTEVYRQLSSHAGLSALIATRIYPLPGPQGATRPYVTYQRITTVPTYTHDGPSLDAIGNDIVQFDCYADDQDQARAVAVQVKSALDNWSSPGVHRAFIQDDRDFYDDEVKLQRVSVDAEIWSVLSAP